MNKKLIWGIIIAVILIVGFCLLYFPSPISPGYKNSKSYEIGIEPTKTDNNLVASSSVQTETKVSASLVSSAPFIESAIVKDENGKISFILTGKNFSNKEVFVGVSQNAAANFYPSSHVKVIVSNNGTKLEVGPLSVTHGKTYPVRVISNTDNFLLKGATSADSNEVLVTVPFTN